LPRSREHAAASVRWSVVWGSILVAAALGGALWFLVLRDGAPIGGDDRETPEFSFLVRRVSSEAIDGKASKGALEGVAEELRSSLDTMYAAGFVDPEKWEDGSFPEVIEAFAGEATDAARADLDDLSLGQAFSQVEFVEPRRSVMDVEFLLTESRQPFAAVARVTFRATGELADGRVLRILHEGRYMMRRIDGRWRIVSYDVDGKIRPGRPVQETP
jgi:hypothetical protein